MSKKAPFSTASASSRSDRDLLQHFKQSFSNNKTSSLLDKKRKISELIIENLDDEEIGKSETKSAKLEISEAQQTEDQDSSFNIDDALDEFDAADRQSGLSPSVVIRKPAKSITLQKSPVSSNDTLSSFGTNRRRDDGSSDQLSFIERILEGENIEEVDEDVSNSPVIVQSKMPPRLLLDLSTQISSQVDEHREDFMAFNESKAIESPNLSQSQTLVTNSEHPRIIDTTCFDEISTPTTSHHHQARTILLKYNVDDLLVNEYQVSRSTRHRIQNNLVDEILRQELTESPQKERCNLESVANPALTHLSQSRSDQDGEVLSQSIEVLSLKDTNQSQQSQQDTIRDEFDCDDSRYIDDNDRLNVAIEDDTLDQLHETTSRPASEWLKETANRKRAIQPLIASSSFDTKSDDAGLEQTGDKISLMIKTDQLNELLGKKRTRYVKNGYAEKLQKLLVRQASSVNFIRHNIDKYKQDMDNKTTSQDHQGLSENVIKCVPIYKQSIILKFTLIHALNVSSGQCIYLLVSNEYDGLKWLNDESRMKEISIKIYPPWRKMYLKSLNKDVFFCTSLIEMSRSEERLSLSARVNAECLFRLKKLACTSCSIDQAASSEDGQSECDLNLFQVSKILQKSKSSMVKSDPDQDFRVETAQEISPSQQIKVRDTVRVPDFILYTQTDAEYYMKAALTQGSSSSTQYMRENSILDAIENSGFLGLVSFKVTIQRIGVIKSSRSNLLTQSTQSQSQRDFPFKRQVIVSDKCGVFAVVLLPLHIQVTEAHKYRFISLKLAEKQNLYQKENEDLKFQIEFLWNQMSTKAQAQAKCYPRVINTFEYLESPSTSSSFEPCGVSKNYISLPTFHTIKSFVDSVGVVSETKEGVCVNLEDVILLKFVEFAEGIGLYYLAATTDEDNFRVFQLRLSSLAHFGNAELVNSLESGYMCLGRYLGSLADAREQKIICINNLLTDEQNQLNSTAFTSITLRELDGSSLDSQLIDSIDFNKMNALRSTFKYMERQKISKSDFIQISTLRIVDICLETVVVALRCPRRCQAYDPIKGEAYFHHVPGKNEWICSVCEKSTGKPDIAVSLSVLIECKGSQCVKRLKLHEETVASLLPIESIQVEKLTKEQAELNEIIDASLIVNKQLGPVFAFVDEIDNTEIKLEELQPAFASSAAQIQTHSPFSK